MTADRYPLIVIQRKYNLPESIFQFGKTNDHKGKNAAYRSKSSQGLRPVCFLKAVEKWEMQE